MVQASTYGELLSPTKFISMIRVANVTMLRVKVTNSLVKFHQLACQCCGDSKLNPDVIIDKRLVLCSTIIVNRSTYLMFHDD